MPAAAKAKKSVSPVRRALIAKVQIARKQLGLEDDDWRAMLDSLYQKNSSANLSPSQLTDLVEHLKKQGFKDRPRKARPATVAPDGSRDADRERLLGKIRALWISLYHLGVLRDPSETALTAMAKRVSGGKDRGIAALAWLNGKAAYQLIEALKKMAEREAGVCWEAHRIATTAGIVLIYRPRVRVLEAQWRLMTELRLAKVANVAGLAAYACRLAGEGAHMGHDQLSEEQQDMVIAKLGEQIRDRLADLGFDSVQAWRKAKS
ncbi:MAG: hypothetical protein COW30_02465 [Rhodospirillales bacterium CG15_BIG_FIL_POST_REV_8_21_14_020_66_15]|nr:MAG: hypothetical protein COW30_02465 [Rhodospirillales bacterium CG15_BIG_FIL_POST_REV_8_21_14_020_66_15]